MPINVDKNKKKSDESHFSGEAVSEAVFDAFDMVEKDDVGKLCLDARLKKGLTQEQASKILKVKVSIIKSFEDGNEFELHGLAYKIGFVRSYAFLLGLDADVLVEEFKESLQLNTYKEDYKFLTPNNEAKKYLPMGAVLSLFISVIIYTGWYYSDRNKNVIQVSNQGSAPLNNVDIVLQNDLTSVSSQSKSITNLENVIFDQTHWDVGTINPVSSTTFTFSAFIPESLKNEPLHLPMAITYYNAHGEIQSVTRVADFYINGLIDPTIYGVKVIDLSGRQTVVGDILNDVASDDGKSFKSNLHKIVFFNSTVPVALSINEEIRELMNDILETKYEATGIGR